MDEESEKSELNCKEPVNIRNDLLVYHLSSCEIRDSPTVMHQLSGWVTISVSNHIVFVIIDSECLSSSYSAY